MAKYQRKTRDVYILSGQYAHGWEELTAELTRGKINRRRDEYRANDRDALAFRIRKTREKI